MPDILEEGAWDDLLRSIKVGRCTPLLGAGACHPPLPLGGEIAQEWAKECHYPLEDCGDLARVAQFLLVTRSPIYPREKLIEYLRNATPTGFTFPQEPHTLLAQLPLPVYLTTNYDDYLERALRHQGKEPRQVLCCWDERVKTKRPNLVWNIDSDPTQTTPVVYHLHGHLDVPELLVLTEDDYLDFLVDLWQSNADPQSANARPMLPMRIQEAVTNASLLFIGYRLADWNFRVILRGLLQRFMPRERYKHVTVQLSPGRGKASKQKQEAARSYLTQYFGMMDIRIYWGDAKDFAQELRRRWEAFSGTGRSPRV